MFLGVHFCRVVVVLGRVQVMPMGDFGMMRSLFMIAGLVVFRGLVMVFGRMFVVVRGLFVMFVNVVAVHRWLPVSRLLGDRTSSGSMKYLRRKLVRQFFEDRSRRPAPTGAGQRQFLPQHAHDTGPIAKLRLTKQSRARIPWAVGAFTQPAKIRSKWQQQK
jgi:hypothetical protein